MDIAVAPIIGAIAAAALSGLTFLAYKHPKAYSKLSLFLNSIIILGVGSSLSWNLSNEMAGTAAEQAAYNLCQGTAYEIKKAVDAYMVNKWFFLAFAALAIYTLFLLSFPLWLLDEQPPEHRS
jgi:hypothetical protein